MLDYSDFGHLELIVKNISNKDVAVHKNEIIGKIQFNNVSFPTPYNANLEV